ncbi:MAG: hypothetical protein RLZZ33_2150 [Pseudomonadota bacterium]|jgi:hypothetical protein
MNRLLSSTIWICWLATLMVASPAQAARELVKTGYARTKESGRLLYIESHFVREAGTAAENRVVLYRCGFGGPVFARKELSYQSQRHTPDFNMIDTRSGYAEGVRRTAQGLRAYSQLNATSPRRETTVALRPNLVIDAGFDDFVRLNWRELEAGKAVSFPFLVPSQLTTYNFKIRKHREVTIEGSTASVIRLNLSGVLAWFTPYIEVSYRQADQVLMRYEGLTNIRNADGELLEAVIDFPSNERRLLPQLDLRGPRIEPLVSRCPASVASS